jgi:hypothetical protein
LLGGDILRRKDDDILKRAHARRAERRSIQEQEATERWKWLAAAVSTRAQASFGCGSTKPAYLQSGTPDVIGNVFAGPRHCAQSKQLPLLPSSTSFYIANGDGHRK